MYSPFRSPRSSNASSCRANVRTSCLLADSSKPSLSLPSALVGFNLVELTLLMKTDSFPATTNEAFKFYSSFPSLRTLHLNFFYFPPGTSARADAAKVVHTFLCACPTLNTLVLKTGDIDQDARLHPAPEVNLFELATTGENAMNSGPPSLTAITLESSKFCLTPGLASCINFRALRALYLDAWDLNLPTPITERFWEALAKMGPSGVQLERLRCQTLSPRLVEFLSGFTGLRMLDFDMNFCPVLPSRESVPGRRSAAAYHPHDLTADELELVNAFFNDVLPKHSSTLEHLIFGKVYQDDERWSMTQEYLRQISRCTALKHLQFHVRVPIDDLVRFAACDVTPLFLNDLFNSQKAIIETLAPMTSLRLVDLVLLPCQTTVKSASRYRQLKPPRSIDELFIEVKNIPCFKITAGRSFEENGRPAFGWEPEGDGVGRFRRMS